MTAAINSQQLPVISAPTYRAWHIEQPTGETLEVVYTKADKTWSFHLLTFDESKDDWVSIPLTQAQAQEYGLPFAIAFMMGQS